MKKQMKEQKSQKAKFSDGNLLKERVFKAKTAARSYISQLEPEEMLFLKRNQVISKLRKNPAQGS